MSGPNKPSEIQSPVVSLTKDKSPKNKPLLDKTLKPESIAETLKKSLATREKVRAEYMRTMREKVQAENFAGKESIQVIPDKSDSTVIYIQTSQATLQVDLHYDESLEITDSLRKDSPTYPINVSLT
jgi:hypothetical protein